MEVGNGISGELDAIGRYGNTVLVPKPPSGSADV